MIFLLLVAKTVGWGFYQEHLTYALKTINATRSSESGRTRSLFAGLARAQLRCFRSC